MRIALVPQLYPPYGGGAARLFELLARGLAARGHEVAVFTSAARSSAAFTDPRSPDHLEPADETIEGYRLVRLRVDASSYLKRRKWSKRLNPFLDDSTVQAWRTAGPWLPELDAALRAFEPQVVAATPLPALLVRHARLAAEQSGARFLIMPCLHLTDAWVRLQTVREELRAADAVTPFSRAESGFLYGCGVPEDRVHRIPGALPLESPAGPPEKSPREKRLIMVARLSPEKSWALVGAAAERLFTRHPELHLDLVGREGPGSDEVEQIFLSLPLPFAKQVTVHRNVDEAEKARLIRAARCLVFPSRTESFGMVVLEAWRESTPVVVAAGGVPASLVRHGQDGLVYEEDTAEVLAESLEQYFDDAELAAAHGAAGRKHLEAEYGVDRFVERYEALFQQLAEKAPKGKPSA